MIKKRCLLIIWCYLLLSVASFAQKNAEEVLSKAAVKYEQSGGISARFVSTITTPKNPNGEDIEGSIDTKDNKFVLITPGMRTIFNGTTQWVYLEESEEVNISNPTGEELQLVNPMLLLKSYKTDFTVSYKGEHVGQNGKSVYTTVLIPKKKNNITKIELQIDKISFMPSFITVSTKNEMNTTITIKDLKMNINKPDSYFVFNESDYPDVEIIDLR